MLDSVKISRRQSEIRQSLADLAGRDNPSEDELRSMTDLDSEYRTNETRYRAALIAEDTERRAAGAELETREGGEWAKLLGGFEVRQAALALSEAGRALDGATAEVVAEMRSRGSYRGIPVPLEALEVRAGETVASGTPDPIMTRPIIDRLFAASVITSMGGQVINIDSGAVEWPVVTSSVTAGWANGETASVAGPTVFATTDRQLKPEQNLGITMKVTRKAMLQSGAALEAAIRRDMSEAIRVKLDAAAFLGAGSSGEPLGVITGASTYGITETAVDDYVTWDVFRNAVTRFMVASAAASPKAVNALIRPEVWDDLEAILDGNGQYLGAFERMSEALKSVAMSPNALAAPTGGPPEESIGLLTTASGGTAPFFMGVWGGVDMIRDPFSDATSGGLRLTGLLTADVTVARPAQLEVLTGLKRRQ